MGVFSDSDNNGRRRSRRCGRRLSSTLIFLCLFHFMLMRGASSFVKPGTFGCCSSGVRKITPFEVCRIPFVARGAAGDNGDNIVFYDDFAVLEEEEAKEEDPMLAPLYERIATVQKEIDRTQRMIKSKPRFLPYEECRKWVIAWGNRWVTEGEWRSWIATGEKRNPYIPSRPDEYYGDKGKWISWDHFLGQGEFKPGNNINNSNTTDSKPFSPET